MDKRTYTVRNIGYAWSEDTHDWERVDHGTAEVEIAVDWDILQALAERAVHTKRGRATAFHGAITARVQK